MNDPCQISLVLFFTRGVSLKAWDTTGTLEREVALYRRLQERGAQISFVTYGDASDLTYADRLLGIRILCNHWSLPRRLYIRLAPWLHWRALRQADVFKTNQTDGAEAALLAKRLLRKKMITRCGYMWSSYSKATSTFPYDEKELVRRERAAFVQADRVVVTTALMRDYVLEHYGLPPAKVQIIPNYVLTDLFIPDGEYHPAARHIVYFGRLTPQKNLEGLLEALRGLDVELTVIGDGPLRQALAEKATRDGVHVRFLPSQPHGKLPHFLKQADLFVLPSYWEGHPKALLEAMACGLPVVGADVPGIGEVIRHGETGYLCDTSPAGIRAALQDVMADAALRARLGQNARQFVVENFSLDRVLDLELNLLHSLVAGR